MSDGEDQNEIREYMSERNGKDEDSHPLGNPTAPPDVDLEMLRGDRIGDTVYSGKWCIETVMKLMKSNVVLKEDVTEGGDNMSDAKAQVVDMDEDLQNQVGVLWDMTSNEEVCDYLYSVGAIESICHIITNSRCPRATEMCVGMLANVITHDDMWKILSTDASMYNVLIPLLANTDQPSLLEVTRFFNTALCHKENSDCYNCLCDWEELVVQELIRILSGSTNGELLKQTSELVYNLIYLDDDEQHFCSSFATAEFVQGLVEASREIGYDHISTGQSHLMDVIYQLTTYTAGAMAMEHLLEPVACAIISYLKCLCHDLSLSNDSITITTLLATLDHVYCRHSGVQTVVFSSPRVIRYILKVLITVYRRLGIYHLISHSRHTYNQDERKAESSSWTEPDDTPTKRTADDAGSWSERATASLNASSRTPDASPVTKLDISWSERRMGTPQADQCGDEMWKRPGRMKRVSKRKGTPNREEKDPDVCNNSFTDSGLEVIDRLIADEVMPENEPGCQTEDCRIESVDKVAGMVNYEGRFDSGERKSGGFSPHSDKHLLMLNKDSSIINGNRDSQNESFETSESVKKLEISNNSASEGESVPKAEETQSSPLQVNDYLENALDPDNCLTSCSKFDSDDEGDGKEDMNHKGDDFEDSRLEVTPKRVDKYWNLHNAIKEFLADFLTTLSQVASKENNVSSRGMVSYMENHCSSTEVRAMAKCVGTSADQPLEKFIEVCSLLKAKHLKSVLLAYIENLDPAND